MLQGNINGFYVKLRVANKIELESINFAFNVKNIFKPFFCLLLVFVAGF